MLTCSVIKHGTIFILDAFEAAFDRVAVVGDTANPGNIADATSSGYAKAFVF